MLKFIKSVPFILKRLRRMEGGREEDNASSIVGMKQPFFAQESHYLAQEYINAEDITKIRSCAIFG